MTSQTWQTCYLAACRRTGSLTARQRVLVPGPSRFVPRMNLQKGDYVYLLSRYLDPSSIFFFFPAVIGAIASKLRFTARQIYKSLRGTSDHKWLDRNCSLSISNPGWLTIQRGGNTIEVFRGNQSQPGSISSVRGWKFSQLYLEPATYLVLTTNPIVIAL